MWYWIVVGITIAAAGLMGYVIGSDDYEREMEDGLRAARERDDAAVTSIPPWLSFQEASRLLDASIDRSLWARATDGQRCDITGQPLSVSEQYERECG